MFVGSSWYPELWPESEWPRDLARMRELGFNIVRLFEFAWKKLEPGNATFDFDWAMRLMDLCHAHGIKVMAGTPTAAPPIWLTHQHPDCLRTDEHGRVAQHGQRKHYNVYSPKYRAFSRRIAEQMAVALGRHPALHSWQIDNEMDARDYSESTRRGFQRWLEQRYGTIAKLNDTWGLHFWSQAYDAFEQIPFPTASIGSIEVPERHHPSLLFAMARFYNENWTAFIQAQADAIRRHSDAPISTNMTPGMQMDWHQHFAVLDRAGASIYKDVEHYHWTIGTFDRMRAQKPGKRYWLLETAPSWSAAGRIWNIHHDAAGVRAFTWLSTLLGGEMTLYWQWREHRAGQEMQHGTLVTATGQWRPNAREVGVVARELQKHASFLEEHKPLPAKVAIMLLHESAWAFSIDPIDDDGRYDNRWRDDYHVPLSSAHIWRDVIGPDAGLDRYDILLMPLMPVVPDRLRAKLRAFVERGGKLLLGPLVGYRDEEFTSYTDRTFGGLEDIIGASSALRFTAHWVESKSTMHFGEGASAPVKGWCEAYSPTTATVEATYAGGYGNGLPGVIRNKIGKGEVLTLGCRTDEATYVRLVRSLGVSPIASGGERVCVVPLSRDGTSITAYGIVNLLEKPDAVDIPFAGVDRLTGERVGSRVILGPMQVRIVEPA